MQKKRACLSLKHFIPRCKEGGINIDKFTFKKIDNEWKIYDINQFIDHWITNNEGSTEEECKEINQDRLNKYKT